MWTRLVHKRRIDTRKGYVMVGFSNVFSCYVWECEWGHRAIDFESEAEAVRDFELHACDRSM